MIQLYSSTQTEELSWWIWEILDKYPALVRYYYAGGCHNLQGRQKLTIGNTCTQVQCRCINLYISNFPLYSEGARACGPHARVAYCWFGKTELGTLRTCARVRRARARAARTKQSTSLHHYPTTFYFTSVYYILGYNQLSNSCTRMAADEPAHVCACSTASTPACTVPNLLSLFEKYQKVPTGRRAANSRWIRRCYSCNQYTSGCTRVHVHTAVLLSLQTAVLNLVGTSYYEY
jgi:hypothetical protein